jgi:hypothetical protein
MAYRIDGRTALNRDRRPAIDPISLAKFPRVEIVAPPRVVVPNAGRPRRYGRFL